MPPMIIASAKVACTAEAWSILTIVRIDCWNDACAAAREGRCALHLHWRGVCWLSVRLVEGRVGEVGGGDGGAEEVCARQVGALKAAVDERRHEERELLRGGMAGDRREMLGAEREGGNGRGTVAAGEGGVRREWWRRARRSRLE